MSSSSLGRSPLSQSGCDHAPFCEGLREVVLILSLTHCRTRPNRPSVRNSAAPELSSWWKSCVFFLHQYRAYSRHLQVLLCLLIVTGPLETRARLHTFSFPVLFHWGLERMTKQISKEAFCIVSKYLSFPVNWLDWFVSILQPVPPQRILTCTTPTEWPEHRVPMKASPTVAPSKSIPLKDKQRPTCQTQVHDFLKSQNEPVS